ncbi:Galactinol synthase 1 [Sesamum angolense]|uniref:Hexosyltransferase n=1 Tax=Sesamum angolense TaxID=2727404 RepID=A0AAE1WYW0_9LAMI|nr:Galactinol synthase 1 [Sesamum angolense]
MVPEIIIPTIKNAAEAERTLGGNNDFSCAYVTFLVGDGDYVKGVICLAKGLRKVKAAYPLVVAVLPDVPEDHRNLLVNQGCLLREIEPVSPPVGNMDSQYIRAYFVLNYCKLRLWEFVEYNKMIYLDADIQVFDNIDHLFDLPSGCLYAVMDCLCEMQGKPCADKDYLNFFFRDTSRPIPPIYNLLVAMLWRHPECVELDKVKVVHYCVTGSKPWKYTGKEQYMDREDMKMLIERWWEIYNDNTLDFITPKEATDQVSG